MLVNLSDVLTSEGNISRISVECDIIEYQYGTDIYKILQKELIPLLLSNEGKGKATIEGSTNLVISMNCDRCLKDVGYKMKLSFKRSVVSPDLVTDGTEEQSFVKGYQLDVKELIYNEILMNWPAKVLCIDDCKGICKMCGKDLNAMDCGCDTFVLDPRMASIKDIFNANKEV